MSSMNEKELKEIIFSHLMELSIPPHLLGYKYFKEVIFLCLNNEEYIYNFPELMSKLSLKFDSTKINMERSMRHSITQAWEINKEAFLKRNMSQKPRVKEFISVVSEVIRLDNLK